MTGLAEVSSRILAIQTQMQQMATRFGAGIGPTGFASALDAARADAAGSVDTSAGTAGASNTSTAARVGNALNPSGPTGGDIVTAARKYLGVPYVFGGTDPMRGLDCSGLVQRVFKDLGVDVPRLVRHQRLEGTPVPSMKQAKPGDLLVFDGYEHIGIYVGNGKMLHAPEPGERVKIGSVYETPTSIRRVLPAEELQTSAANAAGSLLRTAALRESASAAGTAGSVLAGVPFAGLFTNAGARRGISPALLAAVAKIESNYDPDAVSPAGARGLMQIMPGTARDLGVDPFVPTQAVDGAARLLRQHLTEFGSLPLALAAYNAGGGAVRRYDGIPPYAETQDYVVKVQNALRALGKDAS
ncbi:transglycosylase SLT domain-containing protein [Cryptosporangium aurantiacum]|uniref:Cell wall-associated hydrolase, NlpC family n=1 Tax=Cryptosporangium aurantiacum TaxID=134849 RepID=A0A1M7R781_9ACTN|nr:transglycosylase SLT domain-containing protein [Cryptosporangium aurantiacum]SHN42030.1 Cell wall-associated hydrolase, NlpC family [Cryptosporangium aurantiacum]